MYVTMSCRSGADLYRLTTRISERTECQAEYDAAHLGTVLAPLGIEILQTGPAAGSAAGGDGANTTVINLTMPIDLPAIDYLLRESGHEVLDLQPDGRVLQTP